LQDYWNGSKTFSAKMRKIKETPLSGIILRKYEKPFRLEGRELVKKLCLSLGLLQPGDTRDVIVDIFYVLVKAKQPVESKEIEERAAFFRKENNLTGLGITPANVRRQLRRLKELMLIEKKGKYYSLTEGESLKNIFEEKIRKFYIEPISERVGEYCSYVDKLREEWLT